MFIHKMPKIYSTAFLQCKRKIWNCWTRRKSVWSADNTVISPFRDIIVSDVTIDNYVWRNLDKWPTKTAIICTHTQRSYKYEEVYKNSRIFGANLRKKLNISEQDAIAVILPNIPEYPIITFGIISAGGVVAPLNPMFTADEISQQLVTIEAKAVIALPHHIQNIREALNKSKKNIPVICFDMKEPHPEGTISYKEIVNDTQVDLDILNRVERKNSDVAVMFHSSGTTGFPKSVQLTHRNIVANCEQQEFECRIYEHTTDQNQDSTLIVLPLYHIYALSILMMQKMSAGLRLVTLSKFSPDTFLESLVSYKVNLLCIAPPTILFLGSHPSVTNKHLDYLRVITSGAAPLPQTDIVKLLEKTKTDTHFTHCYGMTEVGLATINPIGVNKSHESVGFPLPNVEMRIINEELKNVGPNENGELLIKGPNVMKGYKNYEKKKSDEHWIDNEWIRSGDLAKIDENGALYIVDRLKELIKVNAFQVAPAEIENVLRKHPAVLDAAVVGIPHSKTGEAPVAFVVLKENMNIKSSDIIEFVAKKLAPYKRIKDLKFIHTIPKSPSGKILRKILKQKL